MPSFYVNFDQNTDKINIIDDEFHHIINVFRYKLGDTIPVINGKGLKAECIIEDIKKKSLDLIVKKYEYIYPNKNKIACAFSLLKNKNDLLIVEKLTELGIDELFPIETINSVRHSKTNTLDKMKNISISAAKQCSNAWIPAISDITNLNNLINILIMKNYLPIVASEKRPEESLFDILMTINTKTIKKINNICIIIGPEGGFTDSEYDLFDKFNITQVSISKNILRAETAAISAIAQIVGFFLGK